MLIEPPLFLTASVVWSSDAAATRASDAVRLALADFVAAYAEDSGEPGLEPIRRP
ncbi:MAG: hypothetical protein WDN31_05505 [Hyphomicrobium sp.]